jgi:hypothetical protein
MARVFRTVRVNADGGCGCPTCATSGPMTARRDEVPTMPDLSEELRRSQPAPVERPYEPSTDPTTMPTPKPADYTKGK